MDSQRFIKFIEDECSLQDIANISRYVKNILDRDTKVKEFGNDLSFGEFAQIICNRVPQAYGIILQNRVNRIELADVAEGVSAGKDRGDQKIRGTDDHNEIKVSCLSPIGNYNMVQLREHQDIKNYITIRIKPKEWVTSYEYDILCMPEDAAMELVKKFGGLAHGTPDATKENKNTETRITLNYVKHAYLVREYKVDSFTELKKKLMGDNYEKPPVQGTIFEYYTTPR